VGVVSRRPDDDEQALHGDAVTARVNQQVRDARHEVFRAYRRAREQARRLADGDDGAPPAAGGPPPARDPGR
jgi:hypothetical protein